MQDIMQRLGLPTDDAPVMSQNHAAITLAMAMQKARMEFADREGVKQEARSFGAAKLESLRRHLVPLYSAIPPDADFLDLGHVSQEKPRLFIDILAFVEPSRDQTGFRLVQETRGGRVTVAETADERSMVEAVTAYIARRLVERERALSAETAPVAAVAKSIVEAPETERGSATQSVAALPPAPSVTEQAVSPKLPLTAEEAFRQWTRVPAQVTTQASASAEASYTSQPSVQAAQVEAPKLASETQGISATSVATAAAAAVAAPAIAAVAKAAPVDMRVTQQAVTETVAPMAAAATQATATAVRAGATTVQTVAKQSNGWWLWPLLALIIGAALGAVGLYLFAASLAR